MRAGVTISVVLHALIGLLVFYGLPDFFAPEELELAIPVQIVNISDETTQTEMPEPAPQAPEPPKPEPPKPAAPQPTPPPAAEQPKPEPPKPQPALEPTPAPEPEPVPEPVIAPPEPEAIPEPEAEPEQEEVKVEPPPPAPPKKPEPPQLAELPKEDPEPEPEPDITSVLKNVENLKKQAEEEAEPDPEPTPPQATSQAPLGSELSTSERDAIRQQIEQCWFVDIGMEGIEDVVVSLDVQFNPDGSVYRVDFSNPLQLATDQRYRVLAERARAAVLECSPLRVVSPRNYDSWKNITFRFNPGGMLGL